MYAKRTTKCLSFPELSKIDDISKCLVLDPFLKFKVQKMEFQNVRDYIVCKYNLFQIINKFINLEYDLHQTIHFLKSCVCLKKAETSVINLEKHITDYLSLIHPDSIVMPEQCDSYKSSIKQVKIVANKDFKKNETISILSGCYVPLTFEDELLIENSRKNFSIMFSNYKKCSVLLLGPVALVNHDCDANCMYSTTKFGTVHVVTKKKIKKLEEITVYYSKEYFGSNNENCECKTCIHKTCIHKEAGTGAFSNKKGLHFNVASSSDCMAEQQIESTSMESDLLFSNKMIENTKKLKKLISDIQLKEESLNNQQTSNQRLRNKVNNGLKFDNELYKKLIFYLKTSNLIQKLVKSKLSEEDFKMIVINVYKNYHSSSLARLKKFIQNYNAIIQKDVNSITDINKAIIFAPEYRILDKYINDLTVICISHYYKEFEFCIYKGNPMPIEIKKSILAEMHGKEHNPSKEERTKLDNYLNMYKIYLQRKTQEFISHVIKENCTEDALKQNLVISLKRLSQEEIANARKSNYSLYTSSDQPLTEAHTLNITSVSDDQINDEVGINCSADCKRVVFNENAIHCTQTKRKRSIENNDRSFVKSSPNIKIRVHNRVLKENCTEDVQRQNVVISVKRLSQDEVANAGKTDYSLYKSTDQSLTDTSNLNISSLTVDQINDIVGINCSVNCTRIVPNEKVIHHTEMKRKRSVENSSMVKSSPKIPKRVHSRDKMHNKITNLSFESNNENDNEQVVLLKKLIILSLVSGKQNINLNEYMFSVKKITREIKQNILNQIYDQNVKEAYYTLLDLLMPYRYVITEKVNYLKSLLKNNRFIIENKDDATQCFKHTEAAFYKVLTEIETERQQRRN